MKKMKKYFIFAILFFLFIEKGCFSKEIEHKTVIHAANDIRKDSTLIVGNHKLIEKIIIHAEKFFGEPEFVYHEFESNTVHIDVHYFNPSKYPYKILITSGMSELPMNTPEGAEKFKYIEIMMILPKSWDLSNDNNAEENLWPVDQLNRLAHFPHEYNTWIFDGHTIPNGNPPIPFSVNTKLNTMLLILATPFGQDFFELEIDKEKTIYFLQLFPIYQEEVDFILNNNFYEFMDLLNKKNVRIDLNCNRDNLLEK